MYYGGIWLFLKEFGGRARIGNHILHCALLKQISCQMTSMSFIYLLLLFLVIISILTFFFLLLIYIYIYFQVKYFSEVSEYGTYLKVEFSHKMLNQF